MRGQGAWFARLTQVLGAVAQSGSAPRSHRGGQGFKSPQLHPKAAGQRLTVFLSSSAPVIHVRFWERGGSGSLTKTVGWTWRMSLPMPWGKPLVHPVEPLQLLGLPLAFTQNALLTPEEFAKHADERGVDLRTEHLLELHRRRALVPLLRIVQRPPKSSVIVPVAASAADGYNQYRSPIALVTAAAAHGLLTDPGAAPYRPWDGGLPLRTPTGIHRYPSVFYSPYQLLALRSVEQLISDVSGSRTTNNKVMLNLEPLTQDETAALDGGRQLAILLSALDMHYLPRILLTIHQAKVWEKEDPGFEVASRLSIFGLKPEDLAATAGTLLSLAFNLPGLAWFPASSS
jgi:hypothetical protein